MRERSCTALDFLVQTSCVEAASSIILLRDSSCKKIAASPMRCDQQTVVGDVASSTLGTTMAPPLIRLSCTDARIRTGGASRAPGTQQDHPSPLFRLLCAAARFQFSFLFTDTYIRKDRHPNVKELVWRVRHWVP